MREAKIAAVMHARPDGSMDDWVAQAYDDVPPRLWPVAMRSLLAHVQRIEALDMAPGPEAAWRWPTLPVPIASPPKGPP
jgi:hypothetical protein